MPSSFLTAIPAESYPLYSSFSNPLSKTSFASFIPIYPVIPHIFQFLLIRRQASSGAYLPPYLCLYFYMCTCAFLCPSSHLECFEKELRSEERRVGKGWRSWVGVYQQCTY